MDDVRGVQVAHCADHLVEERTGDGFVEGAELQDLAQVVGSVLEYQTWTVFSLPCFLVNSVLDALVEFDDMGMLQFREDAGLLLKDRGKHLLRVCVVLGGKLDGIELPVKGSQFDSN